YMSVKDYVAGGSSASYGYKNTITPPVLSAMLEGDCRRALELVKGIDHSNNASLMYEVADVKAWAYLGLHLAEKLKGAVALETYRTSGGQQNQDAAIKYLENALLYWDELISITRPIYKDMP